MHSIHDETANCKDFFSVFCIFAPPHPLVDQIVYKTDTKAKDASDKKSRRPEQHIVVADVHEHQFYNAQQHQNQSADPQRLIFSLHPHFRQKSRHDTAERNHNARHIVHEHGHPIGVQCDRCKQQQLFPSEPEPLQ